MPKRFTDTDKYKDSWFIELEPMEKLLFYYLIDNVDNAGFYEFSFRHIQFHLGISKDEILGAAKGLARGLIGAVEGLKNGDVIYLKNFMRHQLKQDNKIALNPYNNYHLSIIKLFRSRLNFISNYEFFNHFFVKGKKIKNAELIEEINKPLKKYLAPEEGLSDSDSDSDSDSKGENKIEYKKVVDVFNSVCTNLPKVQKITKKRKSEINARVADYDLETIQKVFQLVSDTPFLNGENTQSWIADFDWIMNPNNFIKILEGKYKPNETGISKPLNSNITEELKQYD